MISKIYESNFFAKSFTLGLLLLFADIVKDFLGGLAGFNFPALVSTVLFVGGLIICLISLLFLLMEWMTLPFGTQTKRIKLYQGSGNLIAFILLTGSWFAKEYLAVSWANIAALTLALAGLGIAIIFSLMGNLIADKISRKKIILENFDISQSPESGQKSEKTAEEEKKSGRIGAKDTSPIQTI